MEKNPDPNLIDLDPEVFRKLFHEVARMKSMLVLKLLKIPGFELISPHLQSPHLKNITPPDAHEDLQYVDKKISLVSQWSLAYAPAIVSSK